MVFKEAMKTHANGLREMTTVLDSLEIDKLRNGEIRIRLGFNEQSQNFLDRKIMEEEGLKYMGGGCYEFTLEQEKL